MTVATKFMIDKNNRLLQQVNTKGESALTMACRLNAEDVLNLADFILTKDPSLCDKVINLPNSQ